MNNKRINFNLKDRKVLYGILGIALISIFTLTIAYAALNAVLTISGSAQVTSSDWDIYLANPKVKSGSATTDEPVIKTTSTLEFSTTLNMPGDFYEFTVDVINNGSIDAMIENVVKNPELTTEQAKYLKYEITYQNGESINTKQLLAKETTMPIKVRIEYRKDLVASDLPTGQVVLDLSLALDYVQSDGTEISVKDNGTYIGYKLGDEICYGNECFYVINDNINSTTLLAKYNLHVGKEILSSSWQETLIENPTGLQDKTARGTFLDSETQTTHFPIIGSLQYSNLYWEDIIEEQLYPEYGGCNTWEDDCYPTYVYDSNSYLYIHIENYRNHLEKQGVKIKEARIISLEELKEIGCSLDTNSCLTAPSWIYYTASWSGTADTNGRVWGISTSGKLQPYNIGAKGYGVRPLIVIEK